MLTEPFKHCSLFSGDSESTDLVKTPFLDNVHLRRESHLLILPGLRRRGAEKVSVCVLCVGSCFSVPHQQLEGRRCPWGQCPGWMLCPAQGAAASPALAGTFPGMSKASLGQELREGSCTPWEQQGPAPAPHSSSAPPELRGNLPLLSQQSFPHVLCTHLLL